jgi:transcriptional regulator with XRE-family HTH domain
MEQFRAFLLEWLAGNEWNVPRLARESGIADAVIRRWINEPLKRPSDANLRKLAPVLGVETAELLRMCGYLLADAEHPPPAVDPIDRRIRDGMQRFESVVLSYPKALRVAVIDANIRMAEAFKEFAEPPVIMPPEPRVSASDRPQTGAPNDPDQPLTKRQHPLQRMLVHAGA